mmetsp:Transcript_10217/g.20360  ORF Transcript_10217/g.20360 Transcript_10217/m.20360 type:complete len:216 (-) Transcript_10217:114-761(-)
MSSSLAVRRLAVNLSPGSPSSCSARALSTTSRRSCTSETALPTVSVINPMCLGRSTGTELILVRPLHSGRTSPRRPARAAFSVSYNGSGTPPLSKRSTENVTGRGFWQRPQPQTRFRLPLSFASLTRSLSRCLRLIRKCINVESFTEGMKLSLLAFFFSTSYNHGSIIVPATAGGAVIPFKGSITNVRIFQLNWNGVIAIWRRGLVCAFRFDTRR